MENNKEKQSIFDEYAKSKGYDNFMEIVSDYITLKGTSDILRHTFAACDLVQAEQQKRIAENALLNCKDVELVTIINPENKIQ